jgi:hypothetical protein
VHGFLSLVSRDQGKYDLSLAEWKTVARLNDDLEELQIAEQVAKTYRQSSYRAAALQTIELHKQLAKRRYVDPAFIAYDCAEMGDKEQTFAWLDKALAERSGGLEGIMTVRSLDKWHSDPRYVQLLKQMNLQP